MQPFGVGINPFARPPEAPPGATATATLRGRVIGTDLRSPPHAQVQVVDEDQSPRQIATNELRVTVLDDRAEPAARVQVVLFSTDRDRWYQTSRFLRTAAADADGMATLTGIPFGSYYVAAVPRPPDGGADAWQDPSFLVSLAGGATSATIREGEKLALTVRARAR